MKVAESFQITEERVVLVPDFSVPPGRWRDLIAEVEIINPDAQRSQANAEINRVHFNIPDPESTIDQRWRIVVSLIGTKKGQVPTGSEIFVSQEVFDAILDGN